MKHGLHTLVSSPSKIVCVGRNYAEHAKELGNAVPIEPLLFLKPPSSIVATGGTVILPVLSERVEHETELAVVIGSRMRQVTEAAALSHVFGYTSALDITARDLQKKDGQFFRAKGFDTFCPLGPTIETQVDLANTSIECFINGERRQNGNTKDMVFSVAFLLSYISQVMTLEPGDIVLTGTPSGVGPLADGDQIRVQIGHLDPLEVTVKAAAR